MSDDVSAGQVLAYLRMPVFSPTNKRAPRDAVLHALPAFLFLTANLWLVGLGLCWFVAAFLRLPNGIAFALMALATVPMAPLSWALLVRCIEVEADLDQ